MASTPQQYASLGNGSSLQELLAFIDLETAPSLVLDRASLQERASRNARVKSPFISFMLGGCEMALSIRCLQEIGYLPTITPLPNLPAWIKGIIQIRGEILSVVDFEALFGLGKERGYGQNNAYLLFKQQEFKFCLPVHRITGVVNFDEQRDLLETLTPGQADSLAGLTGFIKGVLAIDHRRVCILDSEKLGNSPLIKKWQ